MQNVKLNLIPGSVMPVVNVSQYDAGRQFSLAVYEGSATYSLTGKDVQIRGTKPDGNGFAYDSTDGVVSVSGSTVTISTTQQMTAVGGQTMAELRITSGDTIVGTINFILMVEPSALSDDTPISDTDIPAIERDFEAALEEAEADALKAEGYAVGTQEGVPAQSGEPYYEDNAKYYKEQAEAAASGGGADALKAEGYAVGKQNGVPVTSGSPYYHNNAAYYEGEASTSATNAATSETNAGLSETAAGDSAAAATASALVSEGWSNGEQSGTPVGPGSPYYQNNAAYYAAQAGQHAAGGLIFQGSIFFADLPTTGMSNGDEYNIKDDFTTDSRFIEGAGVSVTAGSDIAWVGGNTNKWNVLATGGGGSDDYSQLINKPQINSVELNGNKTPAELGLATDAAMTGATTGAAGAKGLVPAPAAGDQDKVLYGDGTWKTPTGGSDMTGATASTPGTHGLVPAPAAGDNTKFLRGDGTWAEAGGGGGGGFDYKAWLQAASINPAGYADLAAVLADDETVRHLMTVHLSVDYLTGFCVGDTNIQTILNNDFAAKWINLRDYALDKLEYAFSALMASIGKYGYGEWAKLSESPETWGPKGNVPIMTSNTAPYGVASNQINYSGYEAYKAFDGNDSTYATGSNTNGTGSGPYIAYQFTNPVKVRRIYSYNNAFNSADTNEIKYSDDGATWTSTGIQYTSDYGIGKYVNITDCGYHLYWGAFKVSGTEAGKMYLNTLQFYGREMKVSVPVMTSNTAPYGTVSASTYIETTAAPYMSFDGNESSWWQDSASNNINPCWVSYDFGKQVRLGFAKTFNNRLTTAGSGGAVTADMVIEGSNDGTNWTEISDVIRLSCPNDSGANTTPLSVPYIPIFDNAVYSKFRLLLKNKSRAVRFNLTELGFYGFDYSEYDWDADNPRHYLYDHGVELETLDYTTCKVMNSAILANIGDSIVIEGVGGEDGYRGAIMVLSNAKIDLSPYNRMMNKIGNRIIAYNASNDTYANMEIQSQKPTSYNEIGTYRVASGNSNSKSPIKAPLVGALDVSAINQSDFAGIGVRANPSALSYATITEWWLE